jgi:ubiquinone/menaquinone biosynthesis C-methylase UbiE
MSLRNKLFALTYDRQMAGTEKAGLRAMRERLLAGAHGDVLEIGGGTGLNLTCYGPAVGSLTITEPQPPMLRRLERRVRAVGVRQHSCSSSTCGPATRSRPGGRTG